MQIYVENANYMPYAVLYIVQYTDLNKMDDQKIDYGLCEFADFDYVQLKQQDKMYNFRCNFTIFVK